MNDHDEYCSQHAEPPGPCDCEAGRLAKMCEGMTAHQAEIAQSWEMLEGFGFPPEASGWPMRDITGLLPEAIKCALECIIRQREDLLAEVLELRKLAAGLKVIAAAISPRLPLVGGQAAHGDLSALSNGDRASG